MLREGCAEGGQERHETKAGSTLPPLPAEFKVESEEATRNVAADGLL